MFEESTTGPPGQFDRRLTLSFGAVVLLIIFTVTMVASQMFTGVQQRQEDRLAEALTSVLSESVGRVTFSGKYQVRQLVEELAALVPELAYISVVSTDGTVLAHSDESLNDAMVEGDQRTQIDEVVATEASRVVEKVVDGTVVKEVMVPYRGGFDSQVLGIIRVGIQVKDVRQEQRTTLAYLLILMAVLTVLSMFMIRFLSRRFGGTLRSLAWQLQGVMAHAPLSIIISDPKCRPVAWSTSFEKRFGRLDQQQRFHDRLSQHLPEDTVGTLRSIYESVLARGTKEERIVSIQFAQHTEHWHVSTFPIATARDGEVALCCTMIRDISESKRSEMALLHSQSMLARTEGIARVGSWELDVATNNITWSDELFRLFERDPALGAPRFAEHDSLFVPGDFARLERAVNGILSDGAPYTLELTALRSDGTTWTMLVRGYARHGASGAIDGLYGSIMDITEQRAAERQLRRTLDSLNESQRLAHVGSWDMDLATGSMWWSDELYRIMGRSPELGPPETEAAWLEFAVTEDREMLRTRLAESFHTTVERLEVTYRIIRQSDGEIRTIHALARNEYAPDGSIFRQVGVIEDITERETAEKEKAELQEQLLQAQKMESVGRLAGGVAHDFNNMLQAIIGYSDMALSEVPPTDPLRGDLLEIRKAAQHSSDLTRQLLAFARKQVVAPQVLDLNRTVDGMLKMLKRLLGEEIVLNWIPETDLWAVMMDPTQIDQMLANLLVNARDAMQGVGTITIETHNVALDEAACAEIPELVPGAYVLLAVGDSGAGIEKETMQHIFEPFFTTKSQGMGTGLGLATVYGIIKQNGGFVNVYSEPGQGTLFRLYFPRYLADEQELVVNVPTPVTPAGSETVLLVEDEELILKLGTRLLSGLGYAVIPASTPAQAEELAREHPGEIALIISDVVMPNMNGKELSERVRALRPGIKCLFMSGYTASIIAERGVIEDGVEFLQKPFTVAELASKVRRVLEP